MAEQQNPEEQPTGEPAASEPLAQDGMRDPGASDPGTAEPSPVVQQSSQPPAQAAAPSSPQPAEASGQAAEGAPAAPVSKKDMTPEQRAAAIKAAQEKAMRMKADRDAAKAAAAGETAVVPAAEAAGPSPTAWRIPAAADQQVAVARPDIRQVEVVGREDREVRATIQRRQLLRGGVFGSLLGFLILMIGSFANFFNPRHVKGFGGVIAIRPSDVPKPGDGPKYFIDMKGYIVNLKPGEGGHGSVPGSQKGGLVALYQKCPHLGCTVPWRPEFEFEGEKAWFRCPCHGSTYTRGGARVFGPAPRSMDTFDLTIGSDGLLSVNTGKITLGDTGDPQRGKLPPA